MTGQSRHEDRLYEDTELARFYDLDNGARDDHAFCAALAEQAGCVLDLGCGTGALAAQLAAGRRVVGVDPAAAMLAIARLRPGGQMVEWVQSPAQAYRSDERFDLIVLTGHAFQVFLGEDDQRAVLATIAAHLAPHGRFIFDSRNPDSREWFEWRPEPSQRQFDHPSLGPVRAWNDASHDATTGIVTYQTYYQCVATGALWQAGSRIRFTPRQRLASLIEDAGLAIERWFGDWQGGPLTAASRDFIPLGSLQR